MYSQDAETIAPPLQSNIKFIVLPKTDLGTIRDGLIEKFRSFRLFALGESPEAFASKLATEKVFSKDVWAGRLSNSRATHIFAIKCPDAIDLTSDAGKIEALLDNEWIAQTVMIEMVGSEVAKLAADKSPWSHGSQDASQPDNHRAVEERVVLALNGVYVAPGYRQGGIGTNMVAMAVDEGIRMAKSRGLFEVQFQVRVDGENVSAVKLYERAGFERGSCKERLVKGETERNGIKIPPRDAEILVMHRRMLLNQ
ncbi:hypothetical protein FKW77_004805 [Venturia effusa]|uniref:N-acetyltransferase domain-containing protein n=1 Tax=Venturia effusa TaxID=50376 RepID=A0A517LFJ4_9PEZI|nr:hypothetical protein FKW77_004805 [Venturia effusa]